MRRKLLIGLGAIIIIIALGAGTLFYLASTDEGWERRITALPHMARGYVRSLQPTAAIPTPPPVAESDRARLLQGEVPTLAASAMPLATPTLDEAVASGEVDIPASSTPQASSTPAPPTMTPIPTSTSTPSATPFPLTPTAQQVALQGVQHQAQGWNNCGPTTMAMSLSYFGLTLHQREPASFLKPNGDDKNVSPEQMAAYAESQGFETTIRVAGTIELLQQLVSNGFPVIVEDWILPEDLGGMGHYRLITGFDQEAGHFIAQDSYFGRDKVVPFDELNHSWRVFNRKYIVVYQAEKQEMLDAILGPMADDNTMWNEALVQARADAQANPEDALAWFTLGSSYTALGEMELAAAAFDQARAIGLPLRMLWYQFEPFEAYLAQGRYQDVIDLGYATAHSAGGHEEAYYYQGLGYAAQERYDLAESNFRKALDYNPNFTPAADALAELNASSTS